MTYGTADWGPLVVNTDVDDAIIATLKLWLPTYLTQIAGERSLGYQLATPRFYGNVITDDEFLDHQLPAILVTTAKTKKTVGGANHLYQATWDVTISAVVRGRVATESRQTAALFEGSIRRCMLNKARTNTRLPTSWVAPLNNTKWEGTEVGPIKDSTGAGRYLAAGIGKYTVETDAAAQSFGGPDVPGASSYTSLPTATGINIDFPPTESEG